MVGVVMFFTYVNGDRFVKSCGSSHGAARNHVGVNSVKSAVNQNPAQSAIERCDTAAANRVVCPIVQFVNTPPPLPPVTPILVVSMSPRFITSSTPAIRSL